MGIVVVVAVRAVAAELGNTTNLCAFSLNCKCVRCVRHSTSCPGSGRLEAGGEVDEGDAVGGQFDKGGGCGAYLS